jgi:hypothetical protein
MICLRASDCIAIFFTVIAGLFFLEAWTSRGVMHHLARRIGYVFVILACLVYLARAVAEVWL